MAMHLPPEVLLLILERLNHNLDRFSVLQVCQNWNTALSCAVYSSVTITAPEALPEFGKAIRRNTRLASTLRELIIPDFEDFASYSITRGHYKHTLCHEVLKGFTEDANQLAFWKYELDNADTYAWLAFILLALPNLKHLDLFWNSSSDLVIEAVSRIAGKGSNSWKPRGLQRLEKFTVRIWDYYNRSPARELVPFLQLPAIRALHLSGIHEEPTEMAQNIWASTEPQPGLSTVREIVLHESNCRLGAAELITSCANLEYFEYQHSNEAIYERKYWSYRCHPFHKTLSTQKHSLKVLRLNDVGITKFLEDIDCEALERREAEDQAFFGSLVNFTALRELRMPVRNLLDSTGGQEPSQSLRDILPPSIEFLCLAKTDMMEYTMLDSQLRGLLGVRAQDFPFLRKIVLQLYQMELLPGEHEMHWKKKNWGVPEHTKEVFAQVQRICENQGVEFGFASDGEHQVLLKGKVVHDTYEL